MALTNVMLHRWPVSLGLAASLMACSSDPTALDGGFSPGLGTIGPEGGQVGFGALVLVVPPGALTLETQIRVSEVSDVAGLTFAGELRSPFYRLEPAGLKFDIPALVRFVTDGPQRPQIVWSESADPLRLAPLETVVEPGVVMANVTHFSVGGVVELTVSPPDAGPTDVGAGVPDTGMDAGPPDATPDGGPADASPLDASPLDASVPDTGVVPVIQPTTLNAPDACLTRTTTLSVSGAVVASWSLIPPRELSITYGIDPYPNSSFDPVTGVVIFSPTGTLSGYLRGFGAIATLVGGGMVQRVWAFDAPGLGSYVYGFGGPAVFTANVIPDVSRSTAAAYAQSIAAPATTHPCSGVGYSIESTSSCGGAPGSFMTLNNSGALTVDPAGLVGRPDGTYCIRVHARQFGSQVYFQSMDYTFQVGP